MKLAENSKASSTKRTRHFDIKMFYIADLIRNNLVTIKYYPTVIILADYITKPQTRVKFNGFQDYVLNLSDYILLMVIRSMLANE